MASIGFFLQKLSNPKLFPGDIVEYPRNKYFSHFGIYFGERDGVPYVAHLTCRGQCFPAAAARLSSKCMKKFN